MRNLSLWNDNSSFSPWRGLMDLQRNMDRLFDEAFRNQSESWNDSSALRPACDLEETESHFVLNVDLPGVPRKDISVEIKDGILSVSAERKSETKNSGYSERRFGRFERQVSLPAGIDAEKIEAQYQDGVLTLAIPKAESAKPRQIKIGEGSQKSSFFTKLVGGNKEAEKVTTKSATNAA